MGSVGGRVPGLGNHYGMQSVISNRDARCVTIGYRLSGEASQRLQSSDGKFSEAHLVQTYRISATI